jgi:hypothetical protein
VPTQWQASTLNVYFHVLMASGSKVLACNAIPHMLRAADSKAATNDFCGGCVPSTRTTQATLELKIEPVNPMPSKSVRAIAGSDRFLRRQAWVTTDFTVGVAP